MFPIALQAKEEVAEDTFLYTFSRPEGFSFLAGQYVSMKMLKKVFSDGKGDFRAFSIASPPYRKDVLEFSMRKSDSAFKKNLELLKIGETVEITLATGKCVLPHVSEKRTIVFLIGGVGITPVRSMLLEAAHTGRSEKFYLFYSNQTPERVPFFREIVSWSDGGKIDLTVVHSMTDAERTSAEWQGERGFLDAEKVTKYIGNDWNGCEFYVVGTALFVDAMKKMVLNGGIAPKHIHADNFGGAVQK